MSGAITNSFFAFDVSNGPNMAGQALLLVLAAGAAVVPFSPPLVERLYSTSIYPRLQAVITSVSNLVPFALFDALVLVVLIAWLIALGMDVRRFRLWGRSAARALLRTLVWSAALYLVFLSVWGLNYRRSRLADKLQFDASSVTQAAALSVARTTVERLNGLYDPARPADGSPTNALDQQLAAAFNRAEQEIGIPPAVPGRPKRTWLDLYFRRAGVAGMTDPYFLETLVASDVLPFERPFVVAHEWSHLAGIADESEANFVGWLTCLHGSTGQQYSGWLFLYGELAQAIDAHERADLAARLAPGPRADLQAIVRRLRQQVSPTVSAASWRVYDRYLKANRVEAGAASYGEVVRLVLGVRFGPGWKPLVRGS
jgi:hypothetical protein